MDNTIKIFVDQLKQGKVEKLDRTLATDFLQINEPELTYGPEVFVRGKAYVAVDEFVLQLDINTVAIIPCSICNEPVSVPVEIKGFYHLEPLENIRTGVFDLIELIRETILLETPAFAECEGQCPQRNTLAKYLKKEDSSPTESPEDEGHYPFLDLDEEK